MRAALSWAIESGEPELGLRLAGALRMFWYERGHYGEGRGWLEQVLAKDGRAVVRSKALDAVGWTAYDQGDMDRAAAAAEEGLELSARTRIEGNRAASFLRLLGSVAEWRGDFERAVEFYGEGLALCRRSSYAVMLPWYLVDLGYVFLLQGNHEQATVLNEEAAALYRERGQRGGLEFALDNLGWAALVQGNHE
jgi:tetratricopeptide (TPR) repeat protein